MGDPTENKYVCITYYIELLTALIAYDYKGHLPYCVRPVLAIAITNQSRIRLGLEYVQLV